MCHGTACNAFPEPGAFRVPSDEIVASVFGNADGRPRLAILPDVYGTNPFYQGLATRWAERGAEVFLIDVFAGLGDLPKATREAAFARRHKLRDRKFLSRFADYAGEQRFDGIAGFCLGGLFVFELARQGVDAELVAFYPFPQGLPNQDALDVPFGYLDGVTKEHTVLLGDQDASLGEDVLSQMRQVAKRNSAIDLHLFETSAHGFLADLDSDNGQKRRNAESALSVCEQRFGL